jgi:hypothetical protein
MYARHKVCQNNSSYYKYHVINILVNKILCNNLRMIKMINHLLILINNINISIFSVSYSIIGKISFMD